MLSRAMTRRMRIGSGTALTLARCRRSPSSTLSRRGRALHVRRPAGRHRPRVPRCRRGRSGCRRGSARAGAVPLRPPRHRPPHRRSGIRADARGAVRGARGRPRRPAERPRLPGPRAGARAARACVVLLPDAEASARMSDKLEAHRFFVELGIPSPRSWAPEEVPADARYPVLVKAREGFGSRNIHRAADPDELAFFLGVYGRCLLRAGGLLRRGVLDRRLLGHGRPLSQRDPADDAALEGRRVDQGRVAQGPGADRARRPHRGGGRGQGPRERAVLPRAGRLAPRSPT